MTTAEEESAEINNTSFNDTTRTESGIFTDLGNTSTIVGVGGGVEAGGLDLDTIRMRKLEQYDDLLGEVSLALGEFEEAMAQ